MSAQFLPNTKLRYPFYWAYTKELHWKCDLQQPDHLRKPKKNPKKNKEEKKPLKNYCCRMAKPSPGTAPRQALPLAAGSGDIASTK